jgi:hypothetical protein
VYIRGSEDARLVEFLEQTGGSCDV